MRNSNFPGRVQLPTFSYSVFKYLEDKKVLYIFEGPGKIKVIKELIEQKKIPAGEVTSIFGILKEFNDEIPFIYSKDNDGRLVGNFQDITVSKNYTKESFERNKDRLKEIFEKLKKTNICFVAFDNDSFGEILSKQFMNEMSLLETNVQTKLKCKFKRLRFTEFNEKSLIRQIGEALQEDNKEGKFYFDKVLIDSYMHYHYVESELSRFLYYGLSSKFQKLFKDYTKCSSYLNSSLFIDMLILAELDRQVGNLFDEAKKENILYGVQQKTILQENIVCVNLSFDKLVDKGLIDTRDKGKNYHLTTLGKKLLTEIAKTNSRKIFMKISTDFVKSLPSRIEKGELTGIKLQVEIDLFFLKLKTTKQVGKSYKELEKQTQ